ncbi:hypothetical protein QBC32DRAFT_348270 [Pseudoneurospora amorphoporcata]|uniref:Uncharacterized protein n=1 Tax=Pseudoneurospora amorphoporcata TaxID=241081 RepID=A0AAN6NPS4_9PEZI|nr:hypothetical protein QBC32DRAFT_348270 [Pseudoneurospora amorphoporcata]
MPRQHTFTVVPNPLGMQGLISRDDTPATKPQAMTSKQAKKRYKEATKGPKLSKAEQRRLELEEQERIRKELDKQKSANKARIAREKKKAKELAGIQARKKKGLPLVDVHPSQDTISRFIMKGVVNTAPKRDSSGNVKGKAVEEQSRTVSPEGDDSNKENIPDCREEAVESPRKRSRLDKGSPPKRQDAVIIPDKANIQRAEDKANELRPRKTPEQATNEQQSKTRDRNSILTTSENTLQVDGNIGGDLLDKATFQQKSQETPPTITNKEDMPGPERWTESTSQRNSHPRQSDKEGSQSNGSTSLSTTFSKDRIQTPEGVVMVLPKPTRLQPDRHLEDMGLVRPRADVPPRQTGPAREVVKPLPTGMRPRPALGETDGNRSTPPKPSKETVPPRSYQKPELASQEMQKQIPREHSQPKPKFSTPKESVVYSAVETSGSLPSPQPHVFPMPPPPRPPMSACQPSHAARLKSPAPHYPTTATTNPSKPSSTAAHTNKFASQYKPIGPPACVPQRPSPGPPRFQPPMAGPSSGSIHKPKFLPRNHLEATASRAPFLSNTGKPSPAQNIDTPPSSTQLFVMSHLDDLLPSPSQELRELEEDVQPSPISRPPVLTTKQGQVPAVAPKSPFALGPRRFARQTSHVQIAPPRPRMQEVKPVEDDIFPFLSTQDLLFSSQDMRELENGTPCKANSRKDSFQPPSLKPSPKTASSSPSLITNQGHRPSGTASTTPAPKGVSRPVSAKQPEGTHATSNPAPGSLATWTPKASPAFENQQGEVPNPGLPTGSAATHSAPKRTPPPRSPSPQRFFGSSGVGIQILLAMAESEKTLREDEERRQEKARREKLAEERRKRAAEQQAKRAAEQQAKRAAEAKRKRAAEERAKVMERLRCQAEEIAQLKIPSARRADSPMAAPEQRPATQAKQLPGQSIKQLIPSISKVKRPPSGWVPAQRPGMVKPVVEANHAQQPLPRPPLPESNMQGQHRPGQAPQVTKPCSPLKPKSSIPGQHQIQQVLKVPPAASSQETDYGDEDLDGLGLGELGGMGLTQFLGPDKDLSWLDDDDDDF